MINPMNQQPVSQQPAFKGIVIKKIPAQTEPSKFVDFLGSGDPARKFKGANKRILDQDVFTLGVQKDGNSVVWGRTKAAEEKLFNDLSANKDMIPGVEIHKIDDWA